MGFIVNLKIEKESAYVPNVVIERYFIEKSKSQIYHM